MDKKATVSPLDFSARTKNHSGKMGSLTILVTIVKSICNRCFNCSSSLNYGSCPGENLIGQICKVLKGALSGQVLAVIYSIEVNQVVKEGS